MDARPIDRGARRRSVLRKLLGKPGSVRRWLLGSALFLSACALLFTRSGYLGRIAIFILAIVAVASAFRARSWAVGDEDELDAWLRRDSKKESHTPAPAEPKILVDEEEWQRVQDLLKLRERPFSDAPIAPILESDGPSPMVDGDHAPDEPA